MFRRKEFRSTKIKTLASNAPKLPRSPFHNKHQPPPSSLSASGRNKSRARDLLKRKKEEFMSWRRKVAYALGHKNPEFRGKREPVIEDVMRESEGFCFTCLSDTGKKC